MDEVDRVLEEAREGISAFCINECKALCCKRGKLALDEKEGRLFPQESLEEEGGRIRLKLPCPRLQGDNRCGIYEKRPSQCRDYPLFRYGKTVMTAGACPAVQQGLFKEHLEKLKEKGCKVV